MVFMQPLPKLQNELGSFNGYNLPGWFMQTDYPRHIQLY
jgi:hypothetical protein